MKRELSLVKYGFFRAIAVGTQFLLALYLARFWDGKEYANWIVYQTQFALFVQLNAGFPVFFNKYSRERIVGEDRGVFAKVCSVIVAVFAGLWFFSDYDAIVMTWAGAHILYLIMNSGMRSMKDDLFPQQWFLLYLAWGCFLRCGGIQQICC